MPDTDQSYPPAVARRTPEEAMKLANLMSRRKILDSDDSIPDISVPLLKDEAELFAQAQIGKAWGTRSPSIDLCWHRFSLSKTPEQKLSYQRLITALAVAHGMQRHEEGARICAENDAREKAESERRHEALALDRWRDPKPSS